MRRPVMAAMVASVGLVTGMLRLPPGAASADTPGYGVDAVSLDPGPHVRVGARHGVIVALVVGAVSAAFVGAAPSASGVDVPTITTMAFTPSSVSVVGLNGSATATLRLEVHDPVGVSGCGPTISDSMVVRLRRTAGGPAAEVRLSPSRSAGDEKDGTWTATWPVASTRSGTWTVTLVSWCQGQENVDLDPRALPGLSPSLRVVGTAVPTLRFTRIPAVVGYGERQWGVVTLRDAAGRPVAGRQVNAGSGESCFRTSSSDLGTTVRRTDDRGRFVWRLYTSSPAGAIGCFWVLARPEPRVWSGSTILFAAGPESDWQPRRWTRLALVSLIPATASAATGRRVVLSGATSPRAVGAAVLAQRLVSARWRVVATTKVPAAHPWRYRVVVPVLRGEQRWRVVVRASGFAPTASRVVTVTGR